MGKEFELKYAATAADLAAIQATLQGQYTGGPCGGGWKTESPCAP